MQVTELVFKDSRFVGYRTEVAVHANPTVPESELDDEDREVPEENVVPIFTPVMDVEVLAQLALDRFAETVAINELDSFDIATEALEAAPCLAQALKAWAARMESREALRLLDDYAAIELEERHMRMLLGVLERGQPKLDLAKCLRDAHSDGYWYSGLLRACGLPEE